MKLVNLKTTCALAIVIGGILGAGAVMADKPPWAGGGKGKEQRNEQRDDHRGGGSHSGAGSYSQGGHRHFQDQHRVIVRDYYQEQFHGGRCPPGLAKKQNGCMPPGQAKKWQMGRPLPTSVIFYEVPHSLVVQIGLPPPGYRYVRVASDILMIAVGTGMVVDAIQDLGR